MSYADSLGLGAILGDINAFAETDRQFWKPSPLLVELVQRRTRFDSLNPST